VIDLKLGCIKRIRSNVRYLTLSYVWGQVPTAKLTRDNMNRLTQEGSLQGIRPGLPKTIHDAMELTLALGERYLWVDALCLIQDDEDDVNVGVKLMNLIYRRSYLTIVAASGSDANNGLPGAPGTPRVVRQVIADVGHGKQMTVQHSIDWHLTRSVYNQRGWTLQELVLPPRALIFVNDQVFFRCKEANWSEDSWSDSQTHWIDDDDSNISRMPDVGDGLLPSFWAYQKLCEDYSQRKLRNDTDALRAAAGIIRPLCVEMQSTVIEGLPVCYLDHFLLFLSATGQARRRKQFASFSWAGWESPIAWPRENYYWYDDGQLTWEPANIMKWLGRKRLLKFKPVYHSSGSYPFDSSSDQSSLTAFVSNEYHHKVHFAAVYNPEQSSVRERYYQAESSYEQPGQSEDLEVDDNTEFDLEKVETIQIPGRASNEAEPPQLSTESRHNPDSFLLRNRIASKKAREHRVLRFLSRLQKDSIFQPNPAKDVIKARSYEFDSIPQTHRDVEDAINNRSWRTDNSTSAEEGTEERIEPLYQYSAEKSGLSGQVLDRL
jgi:hypothetical protein